MGGGDTADTTDDTGDSTTEPDTSAGFSDFSSGYMPGGSDSPADSFMGGSDWGASGDAFYPGIGGMTGDDSADASDDSTTTDFMSGMGMSPMGGTDDADDGGMMSFSGAMGGDSADFGSFLPGGGGVSSSTY